MRTEDLKLVYRHLVATKLSLLSNFEFLISMKDINYMHEGYCEISGPLT